MTMGRLQRKRPQARPSHRADMVALLFAGILTGNELGSWLVVHPALSTLPPEAHIRAEQAMYRRYGRYMPVLMTATLASAVSSLIEMSPRQDATSLRLSAAAAACYLAMLTLAGNVPINSRILALSPVASRYEEFLRLRRSWDRLHALRNLLNGAGFSLLISGSLR